MLVRLLLLALPLASGFQLQPGPSAGVYAHRPCRAVAPVAGLFGNSEADKARKEAEWQASQRKLEQRRNPIESEIASKRRRNVELATRAAKAGNLPSNWDSKVDERSGQRYFFDKETQGNVTWDPPIDEMVALLENQMREEMTARYKELGLEL